jgi:hypothetical protein
MTSRARATAPMMLFAVVACEPAPAPVQEPITAPTATIAMVRLAADSGTYAVNSGYETPATLVIRDSSAWAAAWATVHAGVEPPPALPAVNFAQDMLVLTAIGQQPNGGHSVVITSSTFDSAGAVVVRAEHRTPGSSCMTSMALVQPVDIARIPQSTAAVRFEVVPVTQECTP